MSAFDEDLFLKGLEQRKATLGAAYVEKNLAAADDFTRPFQEAMTAWCWGFGWGDDVIDAKTRSMMNLSMIGALGKMNEWEIHCRGAISNGVSKEEIRAIIHVIGIYCGVPQALECIDFARGPVNPVKPVQLSDGTHTFEELVRCDHFVIRRHVGVDSFRLKTDDRFRIVMLLDGHAAMSADNQTRDLSRGQTALLPACTKQIEIAPCSRVTLLEILHP